MLNNRIVSQWNESNSELGYVVKRIIAARDTKDAPGTAWQHLSQSSRDT